VILFEDEDFVAINKPAGLASIPGRDQTDSALEMVGRMLKLPVKGEDDPRVRVVHRLDKETSGVLVFAKNRAAQRHLSEQFQNNLVQKEYVALVVGTPLEQSGIIDAPIGVHPTSKVRMAVLKHGGKRAVTEWKLQETFRKFSLVRCVPRTGKTHQIRVHLAHVGMPLAVDSLYNPAGGAIFLSEFKRGYRRGAEEEQALIGRLTLHAQKLVFQDRSEREVLIEAEMPKDFRAVLNMLRKYSRA